MIYDDFYSLDGIPLLDDIDGTPFNFLDPPPHQPLIQSSLDNYHLSSPLHNPTASSPSTPHPLPTTTDEGSTCYHSPSFIRRHDYLVSDSDQQSIRRHDYLVSDSDQQSIRRHDYLVSDSDQQSIRRHDYLVSESDQQSIRRHDYLVPDSDHPFLSTPHPQQPLKNLFPRPDIKPPHVTSIASNSTVTNLYAH